MKPKQFIQIVVVGLLSIGLLGTFTNGYAIESSTMDMTTIRGNALLHHNTYRSTHHAPNLLASQDLEKSAQSWADVLAQKSLFKHSETVGVGENLYVAYTTAPAIDSDQLIASAVKSWYDEVALYSYKNPGFSHETGHFTQIVWKDSTKMGCGAAKGVATLQGRQYNAFYIVCQYNPPGNVQSLFSSNVQHP
jgi:glioma pathogenesis-related protein 2